MTQTREFHVAVRGLVATEADLQYSDFVSGKLGPHVDVTPIVPQFTGIATPFSSLLEMIAPTQDGTHVIFHASDEFQATIPLHELNDALLLFQLDDQPLKKGFPVRLIVPNGSSECLNVKAVVKIEVVRHAQPAQHATFGFKNLVPPTEL
ncbi:molybdopterin-dependent oxidoreductase [Tumebacillus permanentifrigoris]|uniref:Molybdopterin-dependent oxidoreductase-like protein n=1 Tax=Tumebacillus permanentifrigoris TaxID=378543 RepID=A0A316D7M7_9BACL|nr:molybdopterin-dependent oxidoreductase [Tumebacillus permanentifrigoris]PWK12733.1 molybdopterin-dependent oxidoreductase-like protein [Tumebacillus permanentifrigoris]